MKNFICTGCGLQYAKRESPPSKCVNCADDREHITHQPQSWTDLDALQGHYVNRFTHLSDSILGIMTEPQFAIGQEIYLLTSSEGNVLWDCLGYIDSETINHIQALGGLSAIAISHPHFLGSVIEWSRALGNPPIFLHELNREWVVRPDPLMSFWNGASIEVTPGVVMLHCGGHFPGSCVLLWSNDPSGQGALFTSDTILPVEDRRWVSFMYSYPNLLPLGPKAIAKILAVIETISFERLFGGPMYGSSGGRPILMRSAKEIVLASATRYLEHLGT